MDNIKKYWHVIAGVVCVIILGAVYLIRDTSPVATISQDTSRVLLVDTNNPTETAAANPTNPTNAEQPTNPQPPEEPQDIVVHIAGQVNNPGVYTMPANSRVNDLLELAGGATEDADLSLVNLAAFLQDAQQIIIPAEGDEYFIQQAQAQAGQTGQTGGLININTADATQLATLPGIGATIANNIINHREENGPFATIEQLQNVPRIGATTFQNLRDLITVG